MSRLDAALSSVLAHAAGAPVPHGRHPDPAVAEPGPVGVPAGRSDRHRRNPCEADVERVAARHPGGGPAAQVRFKQLGVDREQPRPVVSGRRDQGVRADPGPRAVLLGALEQPAIGAAARGHVRSGRVRRPHAPPAAGLRPRAAKLGQDRHRVGVPLAQPCQRQVLPGQVGQRGPPLPGRAGAGQRQIQPATRPPRRTPARSAATRRPRLRRPARNGPSTPRGPSQQPPLVPHAPSRSTMSSACSSSSARKSSMPACARGGVPPRRRAQRMISWPRRRASQVTRPLARG